MSTFYRGTELVNCGPPRRKGPYEKFPSGKYVGQKVEDIIERDPRYFMWAVKEWLDITPEQALFFELETGGGEIPSQYIKSPRREPPRLPEQRDSQNSWNEEDWRVYNGNLDILPNFDFSPGLAPSWWEEFKRKSKGLTKPSERYRLYLQYEAEELKGLRKLYS